ncbi:MAG: hypothetical protein ACYC09_02435 [Bacteroidota bacterium]
MKNAFSIVVIFTLLSLSSRAQDTTHVDDYSTSQYAALYTMTGIIVPLAIAGTVISMVPPSGGLVVRDGATYGSFSLETGYGDGQKRETGEFTDYRVSLVYTHVFSSKIRDLFRAEVKKDIHFDFVDRRKIFLTGIHIGGGVFSDFPNHGVSLTGGLWLKSPWLPFFGFFPSHTYGLTYRYNKFLSGGDFHEISLGVTSAVTF